MEKTREFTVVTSESEKFIILEDTALGGKEVKLENLTFKVERGKEGSLGNEEVQAAIDAYSRAESNTLGYIAASFAPILVLLSTLQYYDELNDFCSNILISIVVILLGFAGTYYSAYKVVLLAMPLIFYEGYLMKIVNGFKVQVFPSGLWKTANFAALFSMLGGYVFLFILIFRRLWG